MSIEGPSFPLRVRILATVLVLAVAAMALRMWQRLPAGSGDATTALGLAVVVAAVLLGYLSILRSRTRLDDDTITQRWLFSKQVRLDEVTQVRLFAPSTLRWMLVPRFVVRTGGMRVTAFHLGDDQLIAAVRALIERGRVREGSDA